MTAPFFVDTNVLVYAEDSHDPRKQEIAQKLLLAALKENTAFLSTQVLAEFFSVAVKKLGLPAASVQRRIEIYSTLQVHEIRSIDVLDAVGLHRLHGLSIWDALIVQAASASGCATLYTEDLQHDQRFGSVTIRNPFRDST